MKSAAAPAVGRRSNAVPRSLRSAVQKNCDISDAAYAGDYGLCTYLLKMREYYRWEQGLALGATLSHQAVASWVERRERTWQRLQQHPYVRLAIAGRRYDPFESEAINRELQRRGLVYSAGYGRFGKPHFFLARLLSVERCRHYTVFVSAEEYARDLTAPPAMTRGTAIFVRRESLRRAIWERVEEWGWKRKNSAMTRAMSAYEREPDLDRVLEQITDNEVETLVLHELGEILAGDLLGECWHELLLGVARTGAEIMARAVRDHLADCLSTLPALLELENVAALHFYFANLNGIRRELFPALANGYQHWADSNDRSELRHSVRTGQRHWLRIAQEMIALQRAQGARCAGAIEALANDIRL